MSWRTTAITYSTRLLSLWRSGIPPLPRNPTRMLILKPCCLGDVLLTTPFVAALRQHYPAAHITYGVGAWSRPMVATNQHIDAVWTLPEQWTGGTWTATIRALRLRHFDIVWVPDRSPVLSALVAAAGIPYRVGLDSAGRGFGYTHPVPVPDGVLHEANLYNLLGDVVGIQPPDHKLHFFVTDTARASVTSLVAQRVATPGPLIILHPGGGANPGMTLVRKRWLPERWASIADRLIEQYAATIVIVGGPSDDDAVQAVRAAMHQDSLSIVQRWDWTVLAALIERSQLFLGHDTGMMHLACAVSTPTLAVFGPSDPQMYGPYGPATARVWRPTASSPCFRQGSDPARCACAYQCMRDVSVDQVWHATEKLLEIGDSNGQCKS